ncbi:MAG TPA: hypothetical protein VIW69_11145, partial [Candidatus Elarobacter sp.]
GPIAIALDAARADPWYLLAIPAFAVLFRPNLEIEGRRLRAVIGSLRRLRATEPAGRSNGGS